ncbi:MAG: YihA family ribosome biogenesis GTP-binding protein [Bacteroidetes bacterium]|jgi:GTP-binding protein|nr:YihA family ribosome biogenesis GTP-binding protein [Bacteroidota bacterium]MBT5528315.1 YihA family ribosome biogenesis GTP-binding protein [Cytophagia bacterium]MBT3421824.1 YihA family ribosome biogenesis GTP-binding protein [Bacteroidota bacterium]MBT3799938.1 YihA family ribosome biogenesis GTP-binding protein [Bacteroidota bacterium]MBT3935742.1 YihA family ribosome biogenesis GTP-binding protein [Bacteroidota bacterium]
MIKKIIKKAEYISSQPTWKTLVFEKSHEYAFIGRSNVGKSSLINALCDKKKLALVSKKPGKTKMLNLFRINDAWNLMDLPGYGYAKASKTDRVGFQEMLSDYFNNRKNLVNVFVLVDPNIPPQKIDIDFINFLGENVVAFAIVYTKTDKSTLNKINQNIQAFERELLKEWEELPPSFRTSANTKDGIEKITSYIDQLNKEVELLKD